MMIPIFASCRAYWLPHKTACLNEIEQQRPSQRGPRARTHTRIAAIITVILAIGNGATNTAR